MVETLGEKSDCFHAYQQALDDFGITELLSHLKNYADADFNAQLMHLEEEELESLAAILIERLTNSLNGKLIASYLNAIRHGDSHVMADPTHLEIPLPSTNRPADFPHNVIPRYQEGDRIRWRPLTNSTDWGIVIGRFYARHQCQWAICYLIWLDPDSPSAAWTVSDTAWEEDLEPSGEYRRDACSTSLETNSSFDPLSGLFPASPNGSATLSLSSPASRQDVLQLRFAHQKARLPQAEGQRRLPRRDSAERSHSAHDTSALIRKSLRTSPGNYSGNGDTTTPRILTQREQNLIELYSNCQLGLTPKRFYAKWSVTYAQLAAICSRTAPTVQRWFSRGRNYRRPQPADLRHLAIMDFLLEHFEEIPSRLVNILCPPVMKHTDKRQ
jgi:hypothetical protein